MDRILDWYKNAIEAKQPVSPEVWLDGASKMEVLSEDLDEELVKKKMIVNRMISELILQGKKISEAERIAKASQEHEDYLKLEAKRNRVTSLIQLAKKRTELRT